MIIMTTVAFLANDNIVKINSFRVLGFSLSNFSALPLGGVGGSALFNNTKLASVVSSNGQAVTIFNIRTFSGSLLRMTRGITCPMTPVKMI